MSKSLALRRGSALKRSRRIRLLIFFLFFGLTGLHLSVQHGTIPGIFMTVLTWSFFVLCLPVTGKPVIIGKLLAPMSRKHLYSVPWYLNSYFVRWSLALLVNGFTYIVLPYIYLTSVTTFLLYRIMTNPWPYWMIIFVSSLGSIYERLIARPELESLQFRHLLVKGFFILLGFGTFIYLSYSELVIFIFSQTCATR